MFGRSHSPIHAFLRRVLFVLAVSLLFAIAAAAQDSQPTSPDTNGPARLKIPGDAPADVVSLSLTDAQQRAQVASGPLQRLGELQVEAARQHRLGVKSMYFPAITTQFMNLHMSETPGELLTFQRPLTGGLLSVPVGVVLQDQTAVNVVVTQPITQLFGVRQLVKIARADENIARAKAGMPVTEIAQQVEKTFFELLIAQHELAAVTAEGRALRASLVADTSRTLAADAVAALTASLNELLGFPLD